MYLLRAYGAEAVVVLASERQSKGPPLWLALNYLRKGEGLAMF